MVKQSKKQLGFKGVSGWGGKRAGAGRPNLSGLVSHGKRPTISLKYPMHINMRLIKGLPTLRQNELFKEIKKSIKMAQRFGLFVIHFSVQSNHLHLFCEGKSNGAVALGMRALAGRFAKIFRAHMGTKTNVLKKGSIFNGRYHLRILKTPTEVKNALEYVLFNLSKHQKLIEFADSYSSASAFSHWRKLLGTRYNGLLHPNSDFPELATKTSHLNEILSPPRSWLAQSGWMRAC